MIQKENITVQVSINSTVKKVWELYTLPEHIVKWNNASSDWHTPRAENEFKVGGKFVYRMESKDGTQGFDFNGIYTKVRTNELIQYTIEGGRKVSVIFSSIKNGEKIAKTTKVTVIFESETENPIEMQKAGWQSILDNFKKYVENSSN